MTSNERTANTDRTIEHQYVGIELAGMQGTSRGITDSSCTQVDVHNTSCNPNSSHLYESTPEALKEDSETCNRIRVIGAGHNLSKNVLYNTSHNPINPPTPNMEEHGAYTTVDDFGEPKESRDGSYNTLRGVQSPRTQNLGYNYAGRTKSSDTDSPSPRVVTKLRGVKSEESPSPRVVTKLRGVKSGANPDSYDNAMLNNLPYNVLNGVKKKPQRYDNLKRSNMGKANRVTDEPKVSGSENTNYDQVRAQYMTPNGKRGIKQSTTGSPGSYDIAIGSKGVRNNISGNKNHEQNNHQDENASTQVIGQHCDYETIEEQGYILMSPIDSVGSFRFEELVPGYVAMKDIEGISEKIYEE